MFETERMRTNLDRYRVEQVSGVARLVDAATVEVTTDDEDDHGARLFTSDAILIATGSSPFRPAGIPFDSDVQRLGQHPRDRTAARLARGAGSRGDRLRVRLDVRRP